MKYSLFQQFQIVLKYNSLKVLILLITTWQLSGGRINAQNINTVAGNGVGTFCCDGSQATAAEIYYPEGVAVDASGNIYIADSYNNRVRMVNSSGIISTIAGNGTLGYCCDGGQATLAELDQPTNIALDDSGNIYIADQQNEVIRKINKVGIISTFAGSGSPGFGGYSGDGGQATDAKLNTPSGIAVDASGNVYIADENNFRIRKVNNKGIITTFAGKSAQGYSGDGGKATNAELYAPYGVVVDASGNIYIADAGNYTVREVNGAGIITTIAGTGTKGYSGDGNNATAAELYNPSSVTIDTAGDIYIADAKNNRVRQVNKLGVINTIAGNGSAGFAGDGSIATAAELNYPDGVAIDIFGSLYIADELNSRIRKIGSPLGINELSSNIAINIYPNPSIGGVFHIVMNNYRLGVNNELMVYNILGEKVYSTSFVSNSEVSINLGNNASGIYLYRILSEKGELIGSGKLIIE